MTYLVRLFAADEATEFYYSGFTDIGGHPRTTTDPRKAQIFVSLAFAERVAEKLGTTIVGTWVAVEHTDDQAKRLREIALGVRMYGVPSPETLAKTLEDIAAKIDTP